MQKDVLTRVKRQTSAFKETYEPSDVNRTAKAYLVGNGRDRYDDGAYGRDRYEDPRGYGGPAPRGGGGGGGGGYMGDRFFFFYLFFLVSGLEGSRCKAC
jgi:hypothetical protein